MTEEEIKERIKKLNKKLEGYLEVGNTKRVNAITTEIRKWENLLYKIDGSLEKKIERLENFIQHKDLWLEYLHY